MSLEALEPPTLLELLAPEIEATILKLNNKKFQIQSREKRFPASSV
jgi:hypothetical protein